MERREEKKRVGQKEGALKDDSFPKNCTFPDLSEMGIFNCQAKHTNREKQFFSKKNE